MLTSVSLLLDFFKGTTFLEGRQKAPRETILAPTNEALKRKLLKSPVNC